MINSLFSTFDPITTKFQLNWVIILFATLILPINFWISKSRILIIKKIIEKLLIKEFKNITHQKEILIITKSLFIIILIINFIGLIPYVFTPTSHIVISTSIALPIWISLIIYGWINFTNYIFSHLVPTGTPTIIIPIIIIIETIGNIIRPISLSVRLTANIIAGHLIITLLGNINEIKTIILILPIQITLILFESAISIIQAYVFSTLTTLYSREIPYE